MEISNKMRLRLAGGLVLGVMVVALGWLNYNNMLRTRFVDEEDNFVNGELVARGGSLYQEVFSHHQPIPYLVSGAINKGQEVNSIFLLVRNHRWAVVVWAIGWWLVIIRRFGAGMGIAMMTIELFKLDYLGNLFLAESMVIYPVLYWFVEVVADKNKQWFDWLMVGLTMALVTWTLAPLWPVILAGTIKIGTDIKTDLKKWLWLARGALVTTLVVLCFIDLGGYWHDVIMINRTYYIEGSLLTALVKGGLMPVAIWGENGGGGLIVLRIWVVGLAIGLWILAKRKQWKQVFWIGIVLTLSNLRGLDPSRTMYEGFHLLPWISMLIGISCWLVWQTSTRGRGKGVWQTIGKSITVVGMAAAVVTSREWWIKRDLDKDLFVNYSRQTLIGEAIKGTSGENDSLFVAPDEPLIYWQSQANKASRFVFFYDWMKNVPEFGREIEKMFKETTPTYVYAKSPSFEKLDLSRYVTLRNGNISENLLVLKEKYEGLDEEQKGRLEYLNFKKQ